ncbi:hypothetical protein G7Y89_g3631 [Cudoniella acicularis]|uniref:Serine aminopeptidase S33 domain-containing protein n=1 Tax=Cudoniella acicularis TaxID=354080 RepID=A0A8H4RQZ4_9HELO|nr:hypothetical protein G7Y89_g3631 [Cudoniella acicularis]
MHSLSVALFLEAIISLTSPVLAANNTTLSSSTQAALAFERTLWANGSVLDDPWYSIEESTASASAGTLLKLEKNTNTSLYTLPPATALSRFVYQSKTFNGSLVPASAYILWPHTARSASDGYQVVAWAHGTSGSGPNCAPSHVKTLWNHYFAPFQLALQGYVVVGTDYAGLGISKDASGKDIIHEYLTGPSQASDIFYSVEAAQTAFPELSKSFVIAGHSQGGGAAWAAAQRQAIEPVDGYLGAIAISPVTNFINLADQLSSLVAVAVAPSIQIMFPNFNVSDILTPDGVERLALSQQIGGDTATTVSLLKGYQLTKPGWENNPFVQNYQNIVENGGKAISAPLLVIHGEADVTLGYNLTTAAVEKTAKLYPETSIEYVRVSGASHIGGMTSCQWLWMDWIAQRFQGVPAESGLTNKELKAPMPGLSYQINQNWWVAPVTAFYQTS